MHVSFYIWIGCTFFPFGFKSILRVALHFSLYLSLLSHSKAMRSVVEEDEDDDELPSPPPTPKPKLKCQHAVQGEQARKKFKMSDIVEVDLTQAEEAPVPPVPFNSVKCSSPSKAEKAEVERWFPEFSSRCEEIMLTLFTEVLPQVQKLMCRNHVQGYTTRLAQITRTFQIFVEHLNSCTKDVWWQPPISYKLPKETVTAICFKFEECRPWHTELEAMEQRAIACVRLFYLHSCVKTIQLQVKTCMCCSHHCRHTMVKLIKIREVIRRILVDPIKEKCKMLY